MSPVVLASGNGANVFDVDNNRYVDLIAGFGALLLGHGAAPVLRTIEGQAARLLMGLGDVYATDAKVSLLERIAALHAGVRPRVLLCQSGTDAVTAAIKTACLATGRPGLVAFEGAYHGLGYAALPACDVRPSYRLPFTRQLNPHVTFAPYPRNGSALDATLAAVEKALGSGEVGAVLVEPVLGRGGCIIPPSGFLVGLCDLAHRTGALVIADEIRTGLGRTGAMVESASQGAQADILCFGKGLGGGVSISACVASEDVMMAWSCDPETMHTSTHAGSPVACATAGATLDAIRFRRLVSRSHEVGERALATFREALREAPGVVEVRGRGLLLGVEFESGALSLRAMQGMLQKGYLVLTGGVHSEVITLTPPLNINEERLTEAAVALREVLVNS